MNENSEYTTSQVKRQLHHPSDVNLQKRYVSDISADPKEHTTHEICITEEDNAQQYQT